MDKNKKKSGRLPKQEGGFSDKLSKKLELKKLLKLESMSNTLDTINNKAFSTLIKSTNRISKSLMENTKLFAEQFRIENRRFLDGLDKGTEKKEKKEKPTKGKKDNKKEEEGISLLEALGIKGIITDFFDKVKKNKMFKYLARSGIGIMIAGVFKSVFSRAAAFFRLLKYKPGRTTFRLFRNLAGSLVARGLALVGAAMALGTAFNPKEVQRITGIDEKKQKWYHQLGSGLSTLASIFTLGIFDEKEIYDSAKVHGGKLIDAGAEFADTFLGLFDEETFEESKEKIKKSTVGLFTNIQKNIQEIGEEVKKNPQAIGLMNLSAKIFNPMKDYMEGKGKDGGIHGLFNKDIPEALQFLKDIGNAIVKPIKDAKDNLVTKIKEGPLGDAIKIIGEIAESISNAFQKIKDKVEGVAKFLGIDIENSQEKETRLKKESEKKIEIEKIMSKKDVREDEKMKGDLSWHNSSNSFEDMDFYKSKRGERKVKSLEAYIRSDNVDMEDKLKALDEIQKMNKKTEVDLGGSTKDKDIKPTTKVSLNSTPKIDTEIPTTKKDINKLNTIVESNKKKSSTQVQETEVANVINNYAGDTITHNTYTTLSGDRISEKNSKNI